MSKLKPCPFCGSQPSVLHGFPDGKLYSVQCVNRHCIRPSTGEYNDPEEAIEIWNRREDYYKSLYLTPEQWVAKYVTGGAKDD